MKGIPSRLPTLALGSALCLGISALPAQAASMSGTVIDTLESGGYTYAQVETADRTIWAAGPQTRLDKGASVTIDDGMGMPNFHSKSLNRDFPMLYFVTSFTGGEADPAALAHCDKKTDLDTPLPTMAKAEGGLTIAEIIADKEALAGRQVSVRGQVTKVLGGIMGKTWLHIRDNSADDLIATTEGTAAVGDVVLVNGKVAIDKDFGYGYRYDLLVEEANISRE